MPTDKNLTARQKQAKKATKKTAKKARKDPANHATRWKPGQSGNPGGRPRLPDDVKAMRQAAVEQLIREYHAYANGDPFPETPIAKGMRAVIRAFADEGDVDAIRHVWDRVLGKPPQQIEVDGGPSGLVIVVDNDEDLQAEQ